MLALPPKPYMPPAARRQGGTLERTVADDARAQQRVSSTVGVPRRQRVRVRRGDGQRTRHSRRPRPQPGCMRDDGQRFSAPRRASNGRVASGGAPPGRPGPVASCWARAPLPGPVATTSPTTSWPGVPGQADRQVPLGDVQVGAAHPACPNGDQQFRRLRVGHRRVDPFQRVGVHRTGPTHPPRTHRRGGRRWCHQYSMPLIVTAATG